MKTVALVSVGGKSLCTAEMKRLLDQMQAMLVEQNMATPAPYEIRAYDPAAVALPRRRRKRKGRGRHKAGRWGAE